MFSHLKTFSKIIADVTIYTRNKFHKIPSVYGNYEKNIRNTDKSTQTPPRKSTISEV